MKVDAKLRVRHVAATLSPAGQSKTVTQRVVARYAAQRLGEQWKATQRRHGREHDMARQVRGEQPVGESHRWPSARRTPIAPVTSLTPVMTTAKSAGGGGSFCSSAWTARVVSPKLARKVQTIGRPHWRRKVRMR